MAYNLQDRVVLITGASSGIGRCCAIEYHRAGSRVVAAARSLDKLEALAGELGDDRIAVARVDVTQADDREAVFRFARRRFGPVDVLVNNAGWASFGSVLNMPESHVDRMVSLNFLAPIHMIQLVLGDMLERGSGQIVNIASVVGHQPMPRMAVYSATKAALIALCTGLRMELKRTGVDVLVVAPGSTNTPFFDVAASVDVQAVRLRQAQHTPERVARAVVLSSRRRRGDVTLTPAGKLITMIRRVSPRLADMLIYQFSKHAMPTSSPETPAEA